MIKRLQPYAVGVPCYYTAQFQRSFVPHTLGLWNGLLAEATELEPQKFKWSCNAITMGNLPVFFKFVYIFNIHLSSSLSFHTFLVFCFVFPAYEYSVEACWTSQWPLGLFRMKRCSFSE